MGPGATYAVVRFLAGLITLLGWLYATADNPRSGAMLRKSFLLFVIPIVISPFPEFFKFPLGILTVVTGVSGSGKSTLIKKILYPAVGRLCASVSESPGKYDKLEGDMSRISQVEFVDQNPIGKSSRSNPISYVKAYDIIRQLYADQPLSKQRAYKPSHFPF